MKITVYKEKKNIAGEYGATVDFAETQIQIVSDSKKERELVLKAVKSAIKKLEL